MHRLKKKNLFCTYKMVEIDAKTFNENCIFTIKQLKKRTSCMDKN